MADNKTPPNPFAMFTMKPDAAPLGEGVTAAMRAQARIMDALLKQNIELLDFLKGRYEKDRALFTALADAGDPKDAMTVWSTFWSSAMTDYSTEAGRLGSLASATAEHIVEAAKAEAASLTGGKKG